MFETNLAYDLTWEQWALAWLAAFVVGLAKSGIKGIAILIVAILALLFGGKASTGILMPLLLVGDVFAVSYYNRHAQWIYLRRLLPWMMAGVLLGVWLGKDLPEAVFKRGMAVIILLSVVMMYWWDRRKSEAVPDQWWFAGLMGLSAGFTTMIGNLAGAFSNIFFLTMRLPKNHFIGTAAWLFLIINTFKLPFHIFVWETISPDTLQLNLRLLPAEIIGLWAGIRFLKGVRDDQYRSLILLLTAGSALFILIG
ncbi:MAG: sulfite exporter TauE/SafE family protein [Bacteroidetes bacterium]|nr:MAG: sulfite exporter TauE/SafE family protein [Bacteroidota bacterium]